MSLKDYRSDLDDNETTDDELSHTAVYREEINTLKIDKLSNRVTIISIIIPCIVGAILFFAYMDMKEKVTDVDVTKQNQVERISELFERKLNALDVKIAKNRFDLDKELPEIKKQTTQIEGMLTKTANDKLDKKTFNTKVDALEKQLTSTTRKITEKLDALDAATAKKTDSLAEAQKKLAARITDIANQISGNLTDLAQVSEDLGRLKKQVSIVDIRQKDLEKKHVNTRALEEKITETKTLLLKNLQVVEDELKARIKVLDQKILNNTIEIQKPRAQAPSPDDEPAAPAPIVEETLAD